MEAQIIPLRVDVGGLIEATGLSHEEIARRVNEGCYGGVPWFTSSCVEHWATERFRPAPAVIECLRELGFKRWRSGDPVTEFP